MTRDVGRSACPADREAIEEREWPSSSHRTSVIGVTGRRFFSCDLTNEERLRHMAHGTSLLAQSLAPPPPHHHHFRGQPGANSSGANNHANRAMAPRYPTPFRGQTRHRELQGRDWRALGVGCWRRLRGGQRLWQRHTQPV